MCRCWRPLPLSERWALSQAPTSTYITPTSTYINTTSTYITPTSTYITTISTNVTTAAVQVRLKMDPGSGLGRDFCFVVYSDAEEARTCVSQYRRVSLYGSR